MQVECVADLARLSQAGQRIAAKIQVATFAIVRIAEYPGARAAFHPEIKAKQSYVTMA